MVNDVVLVLLATVACFQLVLAVQPPSVVYATNLKNEQPGDDALLRSYVIGLTVPRYSSDEGVSLQYA